MRLGVIYEPQSANAYYRAVMPMRALEQKGHTVVWPTDPVKPPMREFFNCDLVHCYRRVDRLEDLRRLSQRGVAISFDNDDNFAAAEVSEGGTGLTGHRYNRSMSKGVLQTARLADAMTTTNQLLADHYRGEGIDHVTVIENHLDRNTFGFGSKSKHEGVVIGWIAGREHQLDLERIPITKALAALLDVHSHVRVLTVGVRLPLHSDRYEHIREIPFADLLKITGMFDLGIAPLADTLFNRCRSNVKLKEYSAGSAAWLASPVGPYLGLGEAQGGVLVPDDGWFETLDELVCNARRRKRLAKRARRWVKTQTLDRHAEHWENVFHDAVERVAGRHAGVDYQADETGSPALPYLGL